MTRKLITRNLMVLQAKGMIQFPNREVKQEISSFIVDEEADRVSVFLKSGFGLNEARETLTFKISDSEKTFREIFKQFSIEEGVTAVYGDSEESKPVSIPASTITPVAKIEKPKTMNNGKTIGDVREALFATLQDLREDKIDVNKAKAVSSISQTILNSAKIEMEYKRMTGGGGGIKLLEEA